MLTHIMFSYALANVFDASTGPVLIVICEACAQSDQK